MEPSAGHSLPVDDAIIFTPIAQIMREAGADQKGVYLSRIGQRLASHFGHPLRELLGRRRLREVIASSLGGSVKFEDSGPRMTARIDAALGSERKSLRFDPAFWAAFSKPIAENKIRYFHNVKPFRFHDIDINEEVRLNSGIIIDGSDIADPNLSKPERDQEIRQAITRWCERHDFHMNDFILAKKSVSVSETEEYISKSNIGRELAALRAFLEAIPVEERKNFNLPCDIIYRFIRD